MRIIKAFIYALLGGMVAWGYWQRDSLGMAIFVGIFSLAMAALALSPIGRLKIRWDDGGITLSAFPKKPSYIPWDELEKISLDHLGYHIKARNKQFKIRKKVMPESLLRRIKDNIRDNRPKPTA